VTRREEWRRHQLDVGADGEILHLVMVIAGEPSPDTVQTLHALQEQTTTRWTLTVIVRNSWQTAFTALLSVSGLHRSSQRVRVECTDDTVTVDHMLRLGLAANEGSSISLLFPGDVWAPDAVAQLIHPLSPRSVVYADEDSITAAGAHVDPRFKPDYSPEFLLSSSYVGRPIAIGSEIVTHLGPSTTTGPEMEHDLALRACEAADRVIHVTEVLCHRHLGAPESPVSEDRSASHVMDALARRGELADVTVGSVPGTYRVRRRAPGGLRSSLIIPFRDEPQFLRTCIESVDATRGQQDVEFILVDNGSVQPETATLIDRLAIRSDTRVLTDTRPFNWAALNNAAVEVATGDLLVFLNNDIEAPTPGWLDALCAQTARPEIGAVGGRLLYPDRRLQHCGVVIGLGGAAGHILVGLDEGEAGYLNMAVATRECAAVTGACLATRRDVFDALHGFDENLGVDLNDIDFCLRAQRSGLRVLYSADVELIHHESPSRGTAGDVRDIVHFVDRWQGSIVAGDPYLSPHLTRVDSSCALRGPNEEEWWRSWHASLFRN
jgi:GT2 family glycosyltransferase